MDRNNNSIISHLQWNVPNDRRLIGLTGGIATGKTTVSEYLKAVYHLPILDADRYAREAVEPGSIILEQIIDHYGQTILTDQGQLDRFQLGNLIFRNPTERQWLEGLIHPYVQTCFAKELTQLSDTPTIVLAIPLLFEAQLTHWVTEIWVVCCTAVQQRDRLMRRNGFTALEAQDRITAQLPLEEKCQSADVVLDNSGTLDFLYEQIDRAYSR